jgi:ubiquinone/menaquinone biosynthesis C-methylase UbiE
MVMNSNHARLCASPEWAERLQNDILPEVTHGIELGQDMLEIGPGPGAATDWLRHRVGKLTAVELDEQAAAKLTERFAGTNVQVVIGTAAELNYPDESFDSVGSFTMLHHIPTLALQNKVLAEAFRVLRPGGVLIGSDSLARDDLHHFHADDTYNPVEPAALLTRLQTIGFARIALVVDRSVKFVASKAAGAAS